MTKMNNGSLLGRGLTADIYAWGEAQVVKLFHADSPAEWVDYEAEVTRLVWEEGLAVPAVEDIIELEGRKGILYERVDGVSMLQGFVQKPWKIFVYAQQFVEMHAAMHRSTIPDLPSQRERHESAILGTDLLSAQSKEALLDVLRSLPDGDVVCHGDFHPENIIMSPLGPIVIDWITVTRGNQLADVARTTLMMRSPAVPPGISWIAKRMIRFGWVVFLSAYLRKYRRLFSVTLQQIESWIPIIAAARLTENVHGETEWLAGIVHKWLNEKAPNHI